MATFTFTAPDGTQFKRKSKTRIYTHAVLWFARVDGLGVWDEGSPVAGVWKLGSCVGRPDLLAARLEYWGRGSPHVVAVPCDAT